MLLTRFVHFFAMCLWLGGMVAAMVMAIAAQSESVSSRLSLFRVLGKVYSFVIGPSAIVTVLTGVALTMSMTQQTGADTASMGTWVMELTGLLAGIVVLFAGLPTATKLGRLADMADESGPPPAFERMRKRLDVISYVVVALFVLSLFFGTAVQ
jgi:uncharacterized membrane protein